MKPLKSALSRIPVVLVLSALALSGVAFAQSLQVIDLHHRSAQEIIPVLEPLLEKGGALSGQDYKLFVRTSAANLAQLRQAIAQIDVAPRQLRVSVRTGDRQTLKASGAAVSGQVSSSGVQGTVHATQGGVSSENESVMSVQVIEGTAAFVESGSSIPIVTAVGIIGVRQPLNGGVIDYKDLRTGYLVTPRLAGNGGVVLEIEQHSQGQRGNSAQIATQALSTRIAGRAGEWIELGGVVSSSQEYRSGIARHRYETNAGERLLWIRVDPVP